MWRWPLKETPAQVPTQGPGAFGAVRKHDIHTGVDLYCAEGTEVVAVEAGDVVDVLPFTGPQADSPWWLETFAVVVRGRSGLVLYGELTPYVVEGDSIDEGVTLGRVRRVLRKDKGLPLTMLHLELYETGAIDTAVWWRLGTPRPDRLLDPTERLLKARS